MSGSEPGPAQFADLGLAQRLELAEGRATVDFVEARAQAFPESGAQWIEVGGTLAMFDGPSSPVTQTFGLGIRGAATEEDMARIEQFFSERGAPVFHEVSPLADPSALALLNARGYQPFEFTSVMFRPTGSGFHLDGAVNPAIRVRESGQEEAALWADIAARGWDETPGIGDFIRSMTVLSPYRRRGVSFLAELDGQPVATGGLCICDGVALLAGASTVPEGRRKGAQLALLEARLAYAAARGCDIAMMGALPGSASQRNAERHGFRIAYTRIKWRK